VFDSTAVANGGHIVEVTSQSMNPGIMQLGAASINLNVQNSSSAPTSTPSPTATSSPTTTPVAFFGDYAELD
jgi:hypothetical protein